MKRSLLLLFSTSSLLCVLLFASKPLFADIQIREIGISSNITKVASTATNSCIYSSTNSGIYTRLLYQFDLTYAVANSSTVTVQIANSSSVPFSWFSITNNSTTYTCIIPPSSYYILPGSSLIISNSPITANTNIIKVFLGETFNP